MNRDESVLRMHQVAGKSMLVLAAVVEKRKAASSTQDVFRAMSCPSLTHVTMICDNAQAQTLLQPILIVNEHMVWKPQQRCQGASLPRNVVVLRRQTAWMSSDLMTRMLQLFNQNSAPSMTRITSS